VRRGVIGGLTLSVVAVAVAFVWTYFGGDAEPPSLEELKSGVGRVENLNCDGTPFTVNGRAVSGSGFLVGPQVVMTAEHGMWVGLDEPACGMRMRFGDETYPVSGVRVWSDRAGTGMLERRGIDLATLALEEPVDGHVFRIARDGAPVGTRIATIGYPLGGPLKLSRGRISKNVIDYKVPSIAARIDIEGGNSGGPIFDDQGEVLSVVSRIVISGSLTADKNSRWGGVDLPRWWGKNAEPDLCATYPDGGVPGCEGGSARTAKVPIPLPQK
jgi:V8-like Glu-specific endopeptidase